MKVLIACEESQRVCTAFREKGHEAYSCDIQKPSGGHPEWHIKGNVLNVLNPTPMIGSYENAISFITMDGLIHTVKKWDLIIAHPPCTYLTVSGNAWFNESKYGNKARIRRIHQKIAIHFFMQFVNADCDKIAIENPVGVMSKIYRKPDQIIHPWQFADSPDEQVTKQTCLWLKGLSPLIPKFNTKPDIEYKEWYDERARRWKKESKWCYDAFAGQSKNRQKSRSKTFRGIASAMSETWG